MPIFISYSHHDREFVERLAHQLVHHQVVVWLDLWELQVGDSLLSKIQDAITGASALLVILSPSSVESPWCNKEINSGLLRELEERRVVVLPILVEDCQIPIFLREKLYADFRTNFDDGIRTVLDAVARITNPSTGRVDSPKYHRDWALDWGKVDDGENLLLRLRLILVDQAQGQPYTVLSNVRITGDLDGTQAYDELASVGHADDANREIIRVVADEVNSTGDLVMLLEDQFERVCEYHIISELGTYHVQISARRLGADTGRDVRLYLGQSLREILEHMCDVAKRFN